MTPPTVTNTVKRYRMKGKLATVRKKKITGFHALYLRYLYLLRGGRRKKLPPKLPFSVKREVIHLERYEQQFKYLLSSGITTETELEQCIRVLEWDIRLLEEQRKPLYSDYESYLPRCKEITEQLAEMIKDILNASRLQMQMEDVPVTTFSLAECVSELCEPYRLIAETNGLRFQIEIIEDMSVRLPENQLKKALSNILSNAVNYTEAERHIKVKLEKSVLSIQNECVPLSPDELQHIFEPFYRPNRARNPANGGNGLGLYIVKTILDKQGLQYCFTSMKSKTGMEFVIYF